MSDLYTPTSDPNADAIEVTNVRTGATLWMRPATDQEIVDRMRGNGTPETIRDLYAWQADIESSDNASHLQSPVPGSEDLQDVFSDGPMVRHWFPIRLFYVPTTREPMIFR